jgi:hypothetical protein
MGRCALGDEWTGEELAAHRMAQGVNRGPCEHCREEMREACPDPRYCLGCFTHYHSGECPEGGDETHWWHEEEGVWACEWCGAYPMSDCPASVEGMTNCISCAKPVERLYLLIGGKQTCSQPCAVIEAKKRIATREPFTVLPEEPTPMPEEGPKPVLEPVSWTTVYEETSPERQVAIEAEVADKLAEDAPAERQSVPRLRRRK